MCRGKHHEASLLNELQEIRTERSIHLNYSDSEQCFLSLGGWDERKQRGQTEEKEAGNNLIQRQ